MFFLRQAIGTQVILANARVRRKSLSNPRDKNPLNARELIKSENARIEMALYQRQAVNLKPPQQALLLEPCIVRWSQPYCDSAMYIGKWERHRFGYGRIKKDDAGSNETEFGEEE
jgi:hypothetical protein